MQHWRYLRYSGEIVTTADDLELVMMRANNVEIDFTLGAPV